MAKCAKCELVGCNIHGPAPAPEAPKHVAQSPLIPVICVLLFLGVVGAWALLMWAASAVFP